MKMRLKVAKLAVICGDGPFSFSMLLSHVHASFSNLDPWVTEVFNKFIGQ